MSNMHKTIWKICSHQPYLIGLPCYHAYIEVLSLKVLSDKTEKQLNPHYHLPSLPPIFLEVKYFKVGTHYAY